MPKDSFPTSHSGLTRQPTRLSLPLVLIVMMSFVICLASCSANQNSAEGASSAASSSASSHVARDSGDASASINSSETNASSSSSSASEQSASSSSSSANAAETSVDYDSMYHPVLEEWKQRIAFDKTVSTGEENIGDWRYSASPRYVSREADKTGDGFVYCYQSFDGFSVPMLVVADPNDGYKVYGCYQFVPEEAAIATYVSHFRHCKWLCEDHTFRSWSNAPASGGYYRFYSAERPSGYVKAADGVYTIEFASIESFSYGSDSKPGEYIDPSGHAAAVPIEEGRSTIDEHHPLATSVTWNRIL